MDEKGFDDINVVPLVDVMLVLLTIVLTTATFVAMGAIPVKLPRAEGDAAAHIETRSITIDRAGLVFLDTVPVAVEQLTAALDATDRSTHIMIRADRDLALQFFVEVLETIKKMGFNSVSLQTENSP